MWPADGASSVVLARSDAFPDAMVGVPLAHAQEGPLLLTARGSADSRVLTEINRVLAPGATVHLLGGTAALSSSVERALVDAGYHVVRYAGTDRFDTSLLIARALGSPEAVFLATGLRFPDALAAGAAAAKLGRAVLLSDDERLPPGVEAYLTTATVVAVGGPAARAVPTADSVVGTDRYDTAAQLTIRFFDDRTANGLATGENFPDGLAGSAHIASLGGSLLLTPTANLHPGVAALLSELPADGGSVYLYGGLVALSANVEAAVRAVVQ